MTVMTVPEFTSHLGIPIFQSEAVPQGQVIIGVDPVPNGGQVVFVNPYEYDIIVSTKDGRLDWDEFTGRRWKRQLAKIENAALAAERRHEHRIQAWGMKLDADRQLADMVIYAALRWWCWVHYGIPEDEGLVEVEWKGRVWP